MNLGQNQFINNGESMICNTII